MMPMMHPQLYARLPIPPSAVRLNFVNIPLTKTLTPMMHQQQCPRLTTPPLPIPPSRKSTTLRQRVCQAST
jgi:hypothetical protein